MDGNGRYIPGSPTSWTTTTQNLLPGSPSVMKNVAKSGQTAQAVHDAFAADAAPFISTGSIFILYCGDNSFDTVAGATVYATNKSTGALARALGAKICLILNLPAGNKPPGSDWDNNRLAYNAAAIADAAYWDLQVNPIPAFGVAPNPLWIIAGDAHLTNLGAVKLGTLVYAAVNSGGILP